MMRRRLPWWLTPWSTVLRQRALIIRQSEMMDRQMNVIDKLREENRKLRREPPRVVPGTSLDLPTSITPEFVLAGFGRGPAGVRLIASRNLDGTNLTMTSFSDPPPRWLLTAKLGKALIIDKPTYGEALDHMSVIWRNWEAEARGTAVEPEQQRKEIGP